MNQNSNGTMPTLSLAMIARDRGKELRRALASVATCVDEIVIVDAGGSTDDTADVAREFGAKLIRFDSSTNPEAFYLDAEETFGKHGIPGPWTGRQGLCDFASARNVSFDVCTGDYILWIDSDDVVEHPENLRLAVENMAAQKFDVLMLDYEYAHDEAGNPTLVQRRERIIRRGAARWRLPIHEHLDVPTEGVRVAWNRGIRVRHMHDGARMVSRKHGNINIVGEEHDDFHHRNLKVMLVHLERAGEDKLDPRLYFYLGSEWRVLDPSKAIEYYRRYLDVAELPEERATARFHIGQIREAEGKYEGAWCQYAGAALDFAHHATTWFALARIATVRGDWHKVVELTERGLEVARDQKIKASMLGDPQEARYRALLPYSRALIEVGRIDDALEVCNRGLEVNPACRFLTEHKLMCLDRSFHGEAQA